MFSVPAPIPRPSRGATAAAKYESDTATLPYPTHLAITTTPSSLYRGDWGFKRALPLRSTTKSSTPIIKLKAMDSYEHVTEYASAADHALTLEKWQELNLPISMPPSRDTSAVYNTSRIMKPLKGVFEADADITERNRDPKLEDNRWKFDGPWIAGMTDGQFNDYVLKKVRGRRAEFRQFLRQTIADERNRSMRMEASAKGEEPGTEVSASDITDEQLSTHIKYLRHKNNYLVSLVTQFLDLAPNPSANAILDPELLENLRSLDKVPGKTFTLDASVEVEKSSSPYAPQGPPTTHPSAGLSYLRTKSHVYNHPIYGPQASTPPLAGRIVTPKNASLGTGAKLGLAGFIVDAPLGDSQFNTRSSNSKARANRAEAISGLLSIDPDSNTGTRIELMPNHAHIDSKGRVIMEVSSPTEAAKAVKSGQIDDMYSPPEPAMPRLPQPSKPLRSSSGYGLEGAGPNEARGRPQKQNFGDERWQKKQAATESIASLNAIIEKRR